MDMAPIMRMDRRQVAAVWRQQKVSAHLCLLPGPGEGWYS